jgi:hypothetical protein
MLNSGGEVDGPTQPLNEKPEEQVKSADKSLPPDPDVQLSMSRRRLSRDSHYKSSGPVNRVIRDARLRLCLIGDVRSASYRGVRQALVLAPMQN